MLMTMLLLLCTLCIDLLLPQKMGILWRNLTLFILRIIFIFFITISIIFFITIITMAMESSTH